MAETPCYLLKRLRFFSSRDWKRSLLLLQGDSAAWSVECRDLCQECPWFLTSSVGSRH